MVRAMESSLRLSCDLQSLAVARQRVHWFAVIVGADENAAALVADELVANAIRHGAEPIRLRFTSDGARMRIEVSDAGRGAEDIVVGDGRKDRESHFGLLLTQRLSSDWGVRANNGAGKKVWAVLTAPQAPL
jgi:anti-sigma regulatory factor (Ser/Thr protein kinase)